MNSVCDGGIKVNVKGSGTTITKNPWVYVLSNYRIDDCYEDKEKIQSLHARFKEYTLEEYELKLL